MEQEKGPRGGGPDDDQNQAKFIAIVTARANDAMRLLRYADRGSSLHRAVILDTVERKLLDAALAAADALQNLGVA